MPTPTNIDEFLDLVQKSGIVEDRRLTAYLDRLRAASALPADPKQLAGLMVRDGLLTYFQADQLIQGKWKRFTIGNYKVLEKLGAGGMGTVYLCEHKLMRRRVAVKVLPAAKADDPSSLDRFYREARAVAALDHPNIVRAYDIDQDEKLHFLVMEYVDGANLQDIVKKAGPMDVLRACNYIRQAALGLQHAHEKAALVHRDIKPGNILVDRSGIVKILDMGLARFFHDEEDMLTKKYDENVLGTADYLAPEQALDSHAVDIRADIYSLGATFYFCLTGRTPFSEGTVAQKLIWHQTRQPKPIRSFRPDVPEEVVAIIERMMAKDPGQRYQTPQGIVDALAVWTQTPIQPPPDNEMPILSPAALAVVPPGDPSLARPPAAGEPANRTGWQVNISSPTHEMQPRLGAGGPSPTLMGPPTAGPATPAGPRPGGPLPSSASQTRPLGAPVAKVLSSLPATAPLTNHRPEGTPLRQATAPPPTGGAVGGTPPHTPPLGARSGKAAARSASAAAAPAPAPVPTPPAAAEEEEPPWENMTPDTDDPKSQTNTAPLPRSSSGKARSSKNSGKSRKSVSRSSGGLRLWIIIGAISAVLLLLAVGVAVLLNLRPANKPNQDPTPQNVRKPIEVHPTGLGGACKTLQEAITRANPQDRIVVKHHIIESVELRRKQNLTIEAEGSVTWKPPAGKPLPGGKKDKVSRLLAIDNCTDLTIRGFTMDGEGPDGSVDNCIVIWGACPGVALEHLQLKSFTRSGVLIHNCEGTTEKPVILEDLICFPRVGEPKAPAPVGIFFDVLPTLPAFKINRCFLIREVTMLPQAMLKVARQKGSPKVDELKAPGITPLDAERDLRTPPRK